MKKQLTKLTLIACICLSGMNVYGQVNLKNGLLVHYPFSGNAMDVSGNGKNGTVSNAALAKDRCGKANSAYSFNGTNAYIEIPAATLQTQYYSYSLWVNAAEIPGSGLYTYPFAIGATGGGQNIALANNAMTGWSGGGYNNGTPSLSLVAKGSQPSVNTWYHLVFIRDSFKIKLYINGVLNTNESTYSGANTSTGGTTPKYGSSAKALIGCRDLLSQFFFKGLVDDIRIYNRAINQAEIDSLFKESCLPPLVDLTNGLLAHYPFTGNPGDSSGNGKHGTVNKAALDKDRCGKANSAYSFNGTDAYIEIPSATFQTQFYSYSLWVNAAEIPGSGEYTYPFAIGNTGGGQNVALANNSMTGWSGGGYNNGTPSLSLVAKGTQPDINKWYHIVFIRDSFKIKLYINSVLNTNESTYSGANTSTGGTTPNYGSSAKALVGGRDNLSQFYFKGLVDDIRIYNRPLNKAEVDALYLEKNCFTTGVEEISNGPGQKMNVYPNPSGGQFFVDIDTNGEPAKVSVLNASGQEIYSNNISENSSSVCLSNMSCGLYTIILQGTTGSITRKIIVIN